MGFQKICVALVVMTMIIPLNPNSGRAAVVVKSNTTYQYYCNGLLNGCMIGQDLESELDFFMGSNVIRILGDGSSTATGSTNQKGPSQKGAKPDTPYVKTIAKNVQELWKAVDYQTA
ncbi:hypothetical protein PTKIN_Ptkin05aG0216000 [Pterospermum kingtungense]